MRKTHALGNNSECMSVATECIWFANLHKRTRCVHAGMFTSQSLVTSKVKSDSGRSHSTRYGLVFVFHGCVPELRLRATSTPVALRLQKTGYPPVHAQHIPFPASNLLCSTFKPTSAVCGIPQTLHSSNSASSPQ